MTTDTDDPTWGDLGVVDDLDTHDVEPQSWADIYQPEPGVVVFDAGYGDAWVESDTLVEVRR